MPNTIATLYILIILVSRIKSSVSYPEDEEYSGEKVPMPEGSGYYYDGNPIRQLYNNFEGNVLSDFWEGLYDNDLEIKSKSNLRTNTNTTDFSKAEDSDSKDDFERLIPWSNGRNSTSNSTENRSYLDDSDLEIKSKSNFRTNTSTTDFSIAEDSDSKDDFERLIPWSNVRDSTADPSDKIKSPITRCNSETTTSCFISGDQKMNWSEGHSFCRFRGGFLPQEKELRSLHLTDLKTNSFTWSAMFHQSGAYQWFTHKPSVARFIEWEEGYIPKPWTTQCSLFNSVTRKFLTATCDQEHDVLCVIVETDKQKDITPDNLILQLRSNVEDQDGWIEADTKDFQRLTLTCSASLINTGNDITSTVNIHWSKDGIWMTNYQATIHPATILDTFKSSFLPLEVSNEDREAVKQGTFCCEVWVPFTTIKRRSNCFLITLKNWNTFLVTLKIKEDHTRPTSYEIDPAIDILQNYPDSLMTYYKEFQSMIKAPVSVSKVSSNSESQSTGNAIYEFKFHIYPKDLKKIETEGENILRQYEEVAKTKLNSDIFSGDESTVKLTTYCQSFTKTYEYGNVVEYPFTKAAHRYNSPYKCEVEKNKLSFPVCHWNYTHGAEIIFPKMCLRFDMCPRGFTSIEGKVCLRVISNISWDIGFHTAYSFKTAFTLLPNIVVYLYQQNASIIHHVSKYLEKSKIENMWLPLKRRHDKTPLISPYPNQDYYFGDPSGMMKFNWEEGHPRAELKCAVVSIINKTLYSVDCEANSNFVILIDVNKSTGVDEKDFNEENFRDTGFNDAYFDEGNNYNDIKISQNCLFKWMELPSLDGTKICYKIFDHEPFTWEEAKEYCNIKNARLASPQLGFRNWFYAKLLSSKKSWINIKTKNNLKDLTFDYVNWVPRANFTKSYGVMSLDGWFLANQEELYNSTICEAKPRMTYRPKITISRSQNYNKSLCVNIKNIDSSNIVQCFENGVQVLKKSVSNLKDCFSSIPIKTQGYYECETWSDVNSKRIKSNTYLYTNDSWTTYVVIGYDTEQDYDPFVYDSTFFQPSKRNPFDLKCINNIHQQILDQGEGINLSRVYFFEKNETFHYLFAVECIKGNISFCTSETNALNAMNKILRELRQEQCVVHEVRSTIGCLPETTKDIFRNNRTLTWSKTSGTGNMIPEELCILKNGDMVYRTCKGDFLNGYYWNKAPNGCPGKPSDRTIGIWNISKDPSGYFRGDYKTLSELTQQSESLLPVDLYYVSSAFEKLSSHPLSPSHVQFEEVVTTMDNMMSVTNDTLGTIYRKFNSLAVLLDSFQKLSFNSKSKNKTDGRKFALKEKIVAECVDVSKHLSIIGYQSTQLQGNLLDSKKISMNETEVAILLPSDLTESLIDHDRNDDSVSQMLQLLFVVYKTDALFIDPSSKSLGLNVNSHIISATYENKVVEELKEGVKLFFRPKIKGYEMKCVFWDTEKNEMKGGWSEDGCVLLKINEGMVTCECSHLTSFSLLVRYDETFPQSEEHKKVLTLISIIGCGLSMFGLTLVLTTFLLFRKWRKSLSNQILANLSFAILSSLGIFLFGLQQTLNSIICRIVAVSLHYFILASFGWMLVEGVHQYLKFVKVVGTYIPRFMWKALVCAWGIPLLPVIVALAIDIDLYNDGTQSDICWLSKSLFFVGFVPLISLILLVNVILYILIIDNAIIRRKSMSSTLHYRDIMFSQISMAICVFILLGFTWIFGLLAISSANLLFSYLFCVFNTLQGFFIFIFHLCRDQSARRLWRNFLNNGSNSGKTPMTSQFTNSTLHRRQDNKEGAKFKTTTT